MHNMYTIVQIPFLLSCIQIDEKQSCIPNQSYLAFTHAALLIAYVTFKAVPSYFNQIKMWRRRNLRNAHSLILIIIIT